jgi:sec-independent protein translocase protein TatC
MKRRTARTQVKPGSFGAHLEEFRRRLTVCILALVAGSGVGWVFQAPITRILTKPLGEKLYYSSPTGGLDFLMSLCLFTGIIVCLPIVVYNILKFIEPAGKTKLARRGTRQLFFSMILAVAGASFAYFVSLPSALNFLKSFSGLNVFPLISAKEYMTFTMTYICMFAIVFQMPLLISFIDRIKPMGPGKLFSKQRWVIVASFIIAAFATPTADPINQALMAAPLIILFNISVVVVAIQSFGRQRFTKREVHIVAAGHAPDQVDLPIPVRLPDRAVAAEPVQRRPLFGTLPNLRHSTDPALLTVQDESGHRRPLMQDVMFPQQTAS